MQKQVIFQGLKQEEIQMEETITWGIKSWLCSYKNLDTTYGVASFEQMVEGCFSSSSLHFDEFNNKSGINFQYKMRHVMLSIMQSNFSGVGYSIVCINF